jgi:hypothetical protein
MTKRPRSPIHVAILVLFAALPVSRLAGQDNPRADDPDARPPVAQSDLQIVKRAQQIVNAPSKWNRSDTRACPAHAKTFSIYCALEKATNDVSGKFEHRGAAMQEARFVVEGMAPGRNYHHRLMDYNNDPSTTFADLQEFFRRLESRISTRLKEQSKDQSKDQSEDQSHGHQK